MSLSQAMPVSSTATGVAVPAMSAVTCIQPTLAQLSTASNLQSHHLPTTRSHSHVICIQLTITQLSPAYNSQSLSCHLHITQSHSAAPCIQGTVTQQPPAYIQLHKAMGWAAHGHGQVNLLWQLGSDPADMGWYMLIHICVNKYSGACLPSTCYNTV